MMGIRRKTSGGGDSKELRETLRGVLLTGQAGSVEP